MVSLLICFGMTALWVRSQTTIDWVQWLSIPAGPTHGGLQDASFYAVATSPGQIAFMRVGCLAHPWDDPGYHRRAAPAGQPDWGVEDGWFEWHAGPQHDDDKIAAPFWAVWMASLALPIIAFMKRRRNEVTTGHCSRCGYDLRATPDRCPECGAAPVHGPAGES